MFKKISTLAVTLFCISIQSAALADYTVTTSQPLQNYYQTNPYYNTSQNLYQNPYQYNYQNTCQYPNQYQNQYQNTYGYSPYGQSTYGYSPYSNNGYVYPNTMNQLPYSLANTALSTAAGSGMKGQIIRSVGQNILGTLLRGY